jgi:hypothetical protein
VPDFVSSCGFAVKSYTVSGATQFLQVEPDHQTKLKSLFTNQTFSDTTVNYYITVTPMYEAGVTASLISPFVFKLNIV